MINQAWQTSLKASLNPADRTEAPVRLAVLGIGHELCGDDAVGVRVAGLLAPYARRCKRLMSVEAGPAPENFTGPLRRFNPDLVLLVDAAQMDQRPGTIGWLDLPGGGGMSASSHTLPLHILVSYLQAELGCRVALIGIQPEQTFADGPLSAPVALAARAVVRAIIDNLFLGDPQEQAPAFEIEILSDPL